MPLECQWQRICRTRQAVWSLVLLLALAGAGACSRRESVPDQSVEETEDIDIENSLTFDNLNLEQTDEQGQLLWVVQAKQATYSRDRQLAQVKEPEGELYQEGKIVYRLQAQLGEVRQDGKTILLKGNVVAKNLQEGITLTGEELEWTPRDEKFVFRNNLKGTHEKLSVAAQAAEASTETQQVELKGQVVVTTAEKDFQLKTEQLRWNIKEETILGDRPVQIDHLEEGKVADRAVANQLEVSLKDETVVLKENVKLTLQDPEVEVTTDFLTWNIEGEMVTAEQPVRIVYPEEELTFSSDRGQFDLAQEVLKLTGNVRGVGQRRQSRLQADQLTWYLSTQEVIAEGNVIYRQEDPPLSVTGPRAVGQIQDQTVVISGGGVVTEIRSLDEN